MTRPSCGWRRCSARASSTLSGRRRRSPSRGPARQAGTQYPKGVEKYLQLPPNIPDRVRQLAEEATASAQTPYDKALAIEAMLRSLPYETKVPTPPADRDWVDYTLFDVQTGYADSLATSMVVMLRTLGIPPAW